MASLEYDADADALYIYLDKNVPVHRTEEIDQGTMVDVDEDRNVHGVEVLNPGRLWPLAQVLKRYEISDGDAAVLIGACPFQVTTS